MYQTSNPATISHATMEPINQWLEKSDDKTFIKKIIPLRIITSPMLRQSGIILILSFSSCGMFFHAERWMCAFPKKNTKPVMMKRTPKKTQTKSMTDHTFLSFILFSSFWSSFLILFEQESLSNKIRTVITKPNQMAAVIRYRIRNSNTPYSVNIPHKQPIVLVNTT